MPSIVGHRTEIGVGAFTEIRVMRQDDAEPVGPIARPLEAMEGTAAVEIDARIPSADLPPDMGYAGDLALVAREARVAVCEFGHRNSFRPAWARRRSWR